jgi:hypothetical protein
MKLSDLNLFKKKKTSKKKNVTLDVVVVPEGNNKTTSTKISRIIKKYNGKISKSDYDGEVLTFSMVFDDNEMMETFVEELQNKQKQLKINIKGL